MSIWKKVSEHPKLWSKVVCISIHPKMQYPDSIGPIFGGTFCFYPECGPYLENLDYHGLGAWAPRWDDFEIDAWCYAEDFRSLMPEWIEWHNK